MKLQALVQKAQALAIDKDKEESAVILLLEHVTSLKTNQLFLRMQEEVEKKIEQDFWALFKKYLDENIPVQYLVGYSCFYGYDFIVNEHVLIPRFETEELVENILYRYDQYFKGQTVDVCDLATGSGCIGISLALEEKHMRVVATDISSEALEVARENNDKLGADVTFLKGDMLEPLQGRRFDIFVSNPPYIPEDEPVMSLEERMV